MSDMLSQDEINALLGNSMGSDIGQLDSNGNLTDEQKDILGEVGNISMGTAATTLYALLNHKVEISTPTVSIISLDELSKKHDRPCVGLKINYKIGLEGANLLILKQEDVKIIANLMMGGDGNVDNDAELTDLDLSAISEAMNQMVGSSATSLSSMLGYKIDIDTPQAFLLRFDEDSEFFDGINSSEETLVCNSFRMVVGDLIDSEIMQILPMGFADSIIKELKSGPAQKQAEPQPQQQQAPQPQPQPVQPQPMQQQYTPDMMMSQQPVMNQGQSNVIHNNVNVQPAQFQNFDMNSLIQQKENITIIRDVPLEVTVELGRTKKPIREILEFTPGTIIELDKLAGEPIDVLVNGKFVAKGEVVVIDENFGVRITDIISVEDRI